MLRVFLELGKNVSTVDVTGDTPDKGAEVGADQEGDWPVLPVPVPVQRNWDDTEPAADEAAERRAVHLVQFPVVDLEGEQLPPRLLGILVGQFVHVQQREEHDQRDVGRKVERHRGQRACRGAEQQEREIDRDREHDGDGVGEGRVEELQAGWAAGLEARVPVALGCLADHDRVNQGHDGQVVERVLDALLSFGHDFAPRQYGVQQQGQMVRNHRQ